MKILFFSPHTALWVHAFPEALVAEALKQNGHDVVYIGCGRTFSRGCVCMSANRVGADSDETERLAVCNTCTRYTNILRGQFGLAGYDLDSVLSPGDLEEAERIVESVTPKTFLQLTLDGIEVGRAALSTFLLTYKRINLDFTDDEWRIFRIELGNTVRSFLACQKVLDRESPDRVILYSSGYSVNLVWCLLAERRDIPFYYMNAGANLTDRLQKVVIARGHSLQRRLLQYWDRYRNVRCAPPTLAYLTDHFLELLRGRHKFIYSAPRSEKSVDLRGFFGIAPDQRVLVATMSSYDELFAAQITKLFPDDLPVLFPSQIDWIQALVGFMKDRPDLFLVVRIHPREFPNKRDSVKSEHAHALERTLADLPGNVKVNWPDDQVSLYDLADITDVFLNSWSTAGKEMSMLGIPVVHYSSDLIFYPADFNYLGETRDSYFAQIEKALAEGWSAERIRRTYRWMAVEDAYSRLDISDSYREKESAYRPLPRRVIDRVRRQLWPDFKQFDDCRHRAPRMACAPTLERIVREGCDSVMEVVDPEKLPKVSDEEETRALKAQVGRIVQAMYGDIGGRAAAPGLQGHLARFAGNAESP